MERLNSCLDLIFSNTLLSIVLFAILLYATYTDIKYLKIYNKFNISIVIVRLIFTLIPRYGLAISIENLLASFTAFMIFLILAMIFMHKMAGDIKFIGAFMLFFNFEYMLFFIMLASILNSIYAIILKVYLKSKKRKLITRKGYKGNFVLYYIVKFFFVKLPEDTELVDMDEKDFNKYKVPFAPFFLMSYIITYILYLMQTL